MKNEFSIVWSFRNRIDVLIESIKSADKFCPKKVNFCLVDASSEEDQIVKLREYCSTIKDRKVRICESAFRTTLWEAWNLGIMLTDTRWVVFSSSDVLFTGDAWLRNIVNCVNSGGEYILVENHQVFCIDKKIIPRMGWFDESYVNGPHADTDFYIRASENNINRLVTGSEHTIKHEDTAEETKLRGEGKLENRLPMDDLKNEVYFIKKWNSAWPGWKNHLTEQDKPHPPTHISQCQRLIQESNPHPIWTKKYE
jgi:hypothetical protein